MFLISSFETLITYTIQVFQNPISSFNHKKFYQKKASEIIHVISAITASTAEREHDNVSITFLKSWLAKWLLVFSASRY